MCYCIQLSHGVKGSEARSLCREGSRGLWPLILTLSCADTSKLLWLNIPTAIAVVLGLHWLSSLVDIRAKHNGHPARRRRFSRFSEESGPDSPSFALPVPPPQANKSGDKWREQVGSPLVEHAWETLCGSIVQEVTVHHTEAAHLPALLCPAVHSW